MFERQEGELGALLTSVSEVNVLDAQFMRPLTLTLILTRV